MKEIKGTARGQTFFLKQKKKSQKAVKSTDTYSTDTAIKLTHELHGLTDASALPK